MAPWASTRNAAVALSAVVCGLSAAPALGTVNRYDGEVLENNFLMFRKNAMYSMGDAVTVSGAHARASIEVALEFFFEDEVTTSDSAMVQVSAFPAEDYKYLGVMGADAGEEGKGKENERLYCCTEKMAQEGKVCTTTNALVFGEGAKDVVTWEVQPDGDGEGRLRRSYEIPTKGFYYLVISYCDPDESEIRIRGVTRWTNPHGYLPGEAYGFLDFYFGMSVAYLITAMCWAVLCGLYWRELLLLQNCMTVVLAMGLVEVYLRYYDYYHFNFYGERSKFFMLTSLFFLCLKKTVSRLLVLVVSMGFGVVKPSLGENVNKIVAVGAAYFALSYLHLTVLNLNHTRNLTFGGYLLELPVVAIDMLLLSWTISSVNGIIASLKARRQEVKLQLYVSFRRILGVLIAVGCFWSVYLAVCLSTDGWVEAHWETFYRLEAFWDVEYFVVLLLVLYLFSPSASSSARFAYAPVSTWEQDDEEYGEELEDAVSVKGPRKAANGGSKPNSD